MVVYCCVYGGVWWCSNVRACLCIVHHVSSCDTQVDVEEGLERCCSWLAASNATITGMCVLCGLYEEYIVEYICLYVLFVFSAIVTLVKMFVKHTPQHTHPPTHTHIYMIYQHTHTHTGNDAQSATLDCKASLGNIITPADTGAVAHGDANLAIDDFLSKAL